MNARPRPESAGKKDSKVRKGRRAAPGLVVPEPLQHEGVLRGGVWTYVLALLLIAAFSVAFHFITDNIVRQQDATARVVNISGRQRMLSQRVARLALERAAHTKFRPDAETTQGLKDAIDQLALKHQELLHADQPAAVRAVYTSEPYRLDDQMRAFLVHARVLAAKSSDQLTTADSDLEALDQAVQTPLMQALNAAVTARQDSSEASIKHLRTLIAWLTIAMLSILLAEALFLYRPLFKRLALAHEELIDLGRTDPLTGCLNRRAFTQEAHALVEECKATGMGMAVMTFDIDRFKSVNDRFGHSAGDDVIHEMVMRMIDRLTSSQRLCRMGGEEFAVLMRGATMGDAAQMAENFRVAVESTPFAVRGHDGPRELDVTVSIGVADLVPSDGSIFSVLGRADKALYRAKQTGRNRVEVERFALPPVVMMGVAG